MESFIFRNSVLIKVFNVTRNFRFKFLIFFASVFLCTQFCVPTQSVHAGITLIDIETNGGGWNNLTSDFYIDASSDLSSLPDFGNSPINGPLTSAGSGVIPAGFVSSNIVIDSDFLSGGVQPRLQGVGPTGGLPANTILVSDFSEAMVIDFINPVLAFEFSYVSQFGSGPVTLEVTRDSGFTTFFTGLMAPDGGNRYGIIGTNGDLIDSIRLHDIGDGQEGVTGVFQTFAVPEPGTGMLLLFGLSAVWIRRR